MEKQIFVNLPVTDLSRSIAFYEALGFVNLPQFTDETAAALQWSDTIIVMVLTHEKWRTFTSRDIPDARKSAQMMLAISLPSRDEVDAITHRAGASGGTSDVNPIQEHGFMYGRDFEDPDGHVWEAFWMDPKFAQGDPQPEAEGA